MNAGLPDEEHDDEPPVDSLDELARKFPLEKLDDSSTRADSAWVEADVVKNTTAARAEAALWTLSEALRAGIPREELEEEYTAAVERLREVRDGMVRALRFLTVPE